MATGGDGDAHQYIRIADVAMEHQEMLMPIRGFEKMPLVSLEEAVQPLLSILPEIQDYVYVAKQRCKPVPADGLTRDESASIILYSMEWKPHEQCLYFALNSTLRAEDRRELEPWFLYLKLVLTALAQIPSSQRTIYRGVNLDLSGQYPEGRTFVWWGFSSCTSSVGVLENKQFLSKSGERIMFAIECDSGKDISCHSYYQREKEILLLPARQFIVESRLRAAPGLHMIQPKEIPSPICLLQPVTTDPKPNNSSADVQPKHQPGATGTATQPKSNYAKAAASYTTKESLMKMKETTKLPEKTSM